MHLCGTLTRRSMKIVERSKERRVHSLSETLRLAARSSTVFHKFHDYAACSLAARGFPV